MTRLQRLSAELGERRRRLLDLEGLDGTAPAERKGEAEALRSQITDLQGRWDSEHQAEAESERLALGMLGNGDGEPAEVRSLRGRVSLADYLTPASAGAAVAGAPAELNAALGVPIAGPGGGVAVPYAALLGPEHEPMARGVRTPMAAFTTTAVHDGPLQDRPILQRLFGPGLLNQLGVRLDAVEQGRSEWPIITSGTTVGAVAEGTAAGAAVAAVFTLATLTPKRLTGRFEYSWEMAASVPELEAALRRDLTDAITAQMSTQIIVGTGTSPQVTGFDSRITEPADAATITSYAEYASFHSKAVDGIHASTEREVRSVVSPAVYRHAAGVYQTSTSSVGSESGSEALARRSAGCMASPYVSESVAGGQKKKNYLHAAGPNGGGIMRGDSVASLWNSIEILRDPYTQASVGVVLTFVLLWDCYTALRPAAYARVAFDIS